MQSSRTLPAALTLSPYEEVEQMLSIMLKTISPEFLIHLLSNLFIPRAITVSCALDAAAVDTAAPTEVYILLVRPRDQLAGADCGFGGLAPCWVTLSGYAYRAPPPKVLCATKWGKAVSASTEKRELKPLPMAEALSFVKENIKWTSTVVAHPTLSQPPFLLSFLRRTVSGMVADGETAHSAALSEALSKKQVAFLSAINEHVRGFTDKLAARILFLQGIALAIAPDVTNVKKATLTQSFVRKMEQEGTSQSEPVEPLTWALGDPDGIIPSTRPPPRISLRGCQWR